MHRIGRPARFTTVLYYGPRRGRACGGARRGHGRPRRGRGAAAEVEAEDAEARAARRRPRRPLRAVLCGAA